MEIEIIRLNIIRLREDRGLSQEDMADLMFMSNECYADIERGNSKLFDLKLLMLICSILSIDLNELLSTPTITNPAAFNIELKAIFEELTLSNQRIALQNMEILQFLKRSNLNK